MTNLIETWRLRFITVLAVLLSFFTLIEVNLTLMSELGGLSVFALLGLSVALLFHPALPRLEKSRAARVIDMLFVLLTVAVFGYVVVEAATLPLRAAEYRTIDRVVAALGILLILECTRRSTGWALPILVAITMIYSMIGRSLPDWAMPHVGYDFWTVIEGGFLKPNGVFGLALGVMFRYVFPFVLFGAFLDASGATRFIVDMAQKLFGRSPGGPAKIAVVSSGLLGSLSGSAVANVVMSGTFTIPMMRAAGFRRHEAAGIEAAASSGGALVPPIMGAGAYMMLEYLGGEVTLTQILQAAIIPGILYYLSIFLLVHFHARRIWAIEQHRPSQASDAPLDVWSAVMFFSSLGLLITLLLQGMSPFRAVTFSIGLLVLLMAVNRPGRWVVLAVAVVMLGVAMLLTPHIPRVADNWGNVKLVAVLLLLVALMLLPSWRVLLVEACVKSATTGASLVAAAACVGIIVALVSLTGAGTALPATILPLAQKSLLAALLVIMVCSIVLGMGLPSAVCYLLLAILIGPVLENLGVPLLAAHLFVFYFGMMAMVTPPVALAAYAAASIAGAPIIASSWAAFRFALVGFTLPFMFVYRPELLLILRPDEGWLSVVYAVTIAVVGITALAAALGGYLFSKLNLWQRLLACIAALLALVPDPGALLPIARQRMIEAVGFAPTTIDMLGLALLVSLGVWSWRTGRREKLRQNKPAIATAG